MPSITQDYPWTSHPLIVGAPMRLLALAPLAVPISSAGGLGFIGVGNALNDLDKFLQDASDLISKDPKLSVYHAETGILPVGFGFFNWVDANELEKVVEATRKWKPAAVWQFGAYSNEGYNVWGRRIREVSGGKTKVWVQVGCVRDAIEVARGGVVDVLVVQGTDAGGHGLASGAGIVSLVPEVRDALDAEGLSGIQLIAAGGIMEGRGVAAALMLGADGVCLGTRFLASEEVSISDGYRKEVVRATDGGANTLRTSLYDQLRGTTDWPKNYNARGVLNKSYYDYDEGMTLEENKAAYDEAMKLGDAGWGLNGRITTYAGTGVGLVKGVMKAGDIVKELQTETMAVMEKARTRLTG